MPTRNISLTAEQDDYIEQSVVSGRYQNASEAVRDALRQLQRQDREDEIKLEVLRAHLQAGVDQLEQGKFIEVDDEGLDRLLSGLGRPSRE